MFWLGAAVTLCYVPGITGAYIATQWPLLAIAMTFGLLRSGPFTMFHTLGIVFVAYAAVRAPFSPAPQASVFGLWLVTITGLCMWFGTTMTSTKELYAGLAAGAAVSSFVAVLQHFGFTGIPVASGNPAGLYVNSVQQGTVLALIIVALVSERMWIWAAPLLPGVWLAHSRGAWLALAAGLVACHIRRAWLFAAVIAAGSLYLLSPLSTSDAERVSIWQFAYSTLTWFGWGPGMFYVAALPRDGSFSFYPEYAHNDALQLFWEYGIGALLPLAIVCYALSRTAAKGWPVVVAFVVAGCYSMPFFMPITSFLAFVAVGRILRTDGLAVGYGDRRRQFIVPWAHERRRRTVPVASHFATEG